MTVMPKVDMSEVTRLTREGRLGEAMAMLQGAPQRPGARSKRTAGDPAALPPIDLAPIPGKPGKWGLADDAAKETAAPQSARRAPSFEILGGLSKSKDRFAAASARQQPSLPDGARFEVRTFSSAAGSRDYKLFVPSRYSGQPMPLLVMLHGCTQSPDDFAQGTRMNEVAEEEGMLVAYPAQTQAANQSKCWNWFRAGDQQRDLGEPSLLAGIARQVIKDYAVDPARVYVAGLSAGGAAAAIMATAYPDLFAAVGVHSGLACGAATDMPSAFSAMRSGGKSTTKIEALHLVPTIVFHGDGDKTVNAANADHVIDQARAGERFKRETSSGRSPGGMAYTKVVEADGQGRSVLEKWSLHGGGHAWSGGSPSGSYTDPRGPDASREMVRFFRQHANASGKSAR